jgi:hypothetical protein
MVWLVKEHEPRSGSVSNSILLLPLNYRLKRSQDPMDLVNWLGSGGFGNLLWKMQSLKVIWVRWWYRNKHHDIYESIMKYNLKGYPWFRFCFPFYSIYSCLLRVLISHFRINIFIIFLICIWCGYSISTIGPHLICSQLCHYLLFFSLFLKPSGGEYSTELSTI